MERRSVVRFNYLRDSAPDAFEYLRPSRIPEPLRTPLAALATIVVIVGAWWVIEQMLLGQARDELQLQTLRLNASKVELSELKLRKTRVEALLAIDTRLREIRRSGRRFQAALPTLPITYRRAPGLQALYTSTPGFRSTVALKDLTASAIRSPI